MTLKDQHIIDLMLEHSDLSREEIEHNFSIFKDQLANMEVDERIELSPLGEFIKTGTSMRFVPSVELATEINYKYAGMKPLEIVEANKKTPQSATTDEGFTKAADEPVDDTHLKPDKKEHTVDQPAQPNVDQHKPEEEADKEDHTKNTEENISINDGKEEPSYEDKKTENSEEQKPPTVEVDKSRETEVKERVAKESSQAKENDKKPSGKQHRRKVFTPQDKSQKESIFSLLNTIIAIVIIGGIIFLVYKFDNIKERRSAKIAKEEQAVERPKSEVEEANPATDSSGNGNNAAKNSENSNANLNSGKDVVESFDAVNGTNTNADGDSFYAGVGIGRQSCVSIL